MTTNILKKAGNNQSLPFQPSWRTLQNPILVFVIQLQPRIFTSMTGGALLNKTVNWYVEHILRHSLSTLFYNYDLWYFHNMAFFGANLKINIFVFFKDT